MQNDPTITEEVQTVKRKRGDVREDGRVFWQLDKNRKEIWYPADVFQEKYARVQAYFKEYQAKNKDTKKAYLATYYQQNKAKIDAASNAWAKQNRPQSRVFKKKWADQNKGHINTWRAARARERRKTDPLYALREVCRTRIRHAFENRGMKRRSKIAATIGCTWEEFKAHIEKQFKPGMTWENRCLWELDHIIPISSANTEEEIRKLSHFLNIQPLWKEENREKRDKMPGEV